MIRKYNEKVVTGPRRQKAEQISIFSLCRTMNETRKKIVRERNAERGKKISASGEHFSSISSREKQNGSY